MKLRKIILFIFSIFIISVPQSALAIKTEVGEASNLSEYVSELITTLLPIIGGIAVLMMIFAGYTYLTSQGNPEAIGRAKDIIIAVITGIVLLFLIKLLLNQIGLNQAGI